MIWLTLFSLMKLVCVIAMQSAANNLSSFVFNPPFHGVLPPLLFSPFGKFCSMMGRRGEMDEMMAINGSMMMEK
ncbi:hypothetical protein V6N12_021855 [Hibiscus sabdariffa]|uniref:Secreted protein n=1 Tax=Hibiscus sabdariffa TaxID=183260 RepID=A0ABR2FSX9_9ROSI